MKAQCILHANCQGEPLLELLRLSPAFATRWDIRHYTNYTKEPIPEQALAACDLLLYQHLGPQWGSLASQALLANIPPKAKALRIPNMYFTGYWPLLDTKSPMNFGDLLLDKLIASGAHKSVILKIYFDSPLSSVADAEANANFSLEREREKEAGQLVATWPLLEELWRKEKLYYTWNHPGEKLLIRTADAILEYLGFPPLGAVAQGYKPPYHEFEQPLHPQLATLLGLPFCGENTLYPVFGREMTCRQYVSRYIDCARGGHSDSFLGYLQLV